MRLYLVGGAVRDNLLGKTPKDLDYVVVGATVDQFREEFPNAKSIGKAFPVYEVEYQGRRAEIAFARRERKTGPGYKGFEIDADPSVSLLEDLARRDFTMNAMAIPVDGAANLIDPFGGESDIKNRLVRHIGPAFTEDPLRVYRCARFSAQLGFGIPSSTVAICRTVSRSEIQSLSGERVGNELRKAMTGKYPEQFFRFLRSVGNPAFDSWFPELVKLIGTPAGPPGHHDELDAFVHTLMVLNYASYSLPEDLPSTEALRFAALLHDLGKGLTDPALWPKHHGHEESGVRLVERFCERLKLPNEIKDASVLACKNHLKVHKFLELRKGKMVDLIREADRTVLKAEGLAAVGFADALGREAVVKSVIGPTALLRAANAAREETGHPIPEALEGEHIGLYIRNKKGNAIMKALKEESDLKWD